MTKDNIVYNNEIMYSDCPVCGGEKTLEITNRTDNIPYFGDMLETAVSCKNCGYQSSDSISLEHNFIASDNEIKGEFIINRQYKTKFQGCKVTDSNYFYS